MTSNTGDLAQLDDIVIDCTREQFRELDPAPVEGAASPAAAGGAPELACIVGISGHSLRGTVTVEAPVAGLEQLRRARAAAEGELHEWTGGLVSDLVQKIGSGGGSRGFRFEMGLPRVLSGAGLCVKPMPGTLARSLHFATVHGTIRVSLEVALKESGALFEKLDVLVVDDSPAVRHEVSALLGTRGYRVIEACDGVDGMEKVADNPHVAVILCDLNMPWMDGISFVESVKKQSGRASPPIVMLTSEHRAKLCGQALKKGAVGWIVKPF